MRKRCRSILIRLTQEEMDSLNQKAQEAKLSRESFCRQVLNGTEIKQAPPTEYYTLIAEVRKIGININQILKKANSIGLLDVPMIRKALEDNHSTEDMLWKAFQGG